MAFRSFWSAGRATFTTVPSMKTRLDPRIVAARIHFADDFEQGEVTVRSNHAFVTWFAN